MEPFIHLPEYPFIICTKCRFACISSEVRTHLQRHHLSIDVRQRAEIIKAVRSRARTRTSCVPSHCHRRLLRQSRFFLRRRAMGCNVSNARISPGRCDGSRSIVGPSMAGRTRSARVAIRSSGLANHARFRGGPAFLASAYSHRVPPAAGLRWVEACCPAGRRRAPWTTYRLFGISRPPDLPPRTSGPSRWPMRRRSPTRG